MTSKRQRAQRWLGQEAVDLTVPPQSRGLQQEFRLGRNIWAPHAVLASLGRWGPAGTAQQGATAHPTRLQLHVKPFLTGYHLLAPELCPLSPPGAPECSRQCWAGLEVSLRDPDC